MWICSVLSRTRLCPLTCSPGPWLVTTRNRMPDLASTKLVTVGDLAVRASFEVSGQPPLSSLY
jgi:hypothetical protein